MTIVINGRATTGVTLPQHDPAATEASAWSARVSNVLRMPTLTRNTETLAQVDPVLTARASGYARFEGELFGETGPQLSDIDQNRLGDCYFLAALGAIVAQDPDVISNMLRDNGDGTYTATFYAAQDGERVPVEVTVDGDLPVNADGTLVYAGAVDSDGDNDLELWVPLLEKAYAKFQDLYGPDDGLSGYQDLGNGGSAHNVFRDVTGEPATRTSDFQTEQQLLDLVQRVDEGQYVTVSSLVDGADPGWVGRHAYTVVGTYEDNGETMVILRNPWGRQEPENSVDVPPGGDDGVFAISAGELLQNIRSVQYCNPDPVQGMPWFARLNEGRDAILAQLR